jgi:hypothetical protein
MVAGEACSTEVVGITVVVRSQWAFWPPNMHLRLLNPVGYVFGAGSLSAETIVLAASMI